MRGDTANLWRSGEGARIAGLMTCGSVWTCPVCSARVTEARRAELTTALGRWSEQGGSVSLLTVTFPHRVREHVKGSDDRPATRFATEVEDLSTMLAAFATALERWKGSRAYRSTMESLDRAGSVRSLEVTVGDVNGWHPHTHDLLFTRRPVAMFTDEAIDQAARLLGVKRQPRTWTRIVAHLRADPELFERSITAEYRTLRDAWIARCLKVGLVDVSDVAAMRLHCLDLRDGEHAAEYVAKFGREADGWSLASELTRPHAKIGRRRLTSTAEHYTPFQLLAAAADGDAWAGFRFRAFAQCFTGRRMLSWSPGLRRELLGADAELTDEQLAAAEDELPDEQLAGSITGEQLRVVTSRGMLGELLDYVHAHQADQASIDAYIAELAVLIPARWRDTIRRRRTFGAGYALMES